MGVYVKDMDLPKRCDSRCPLYDTKGLADCTITHSRYLRIKNGRPSDCPLVEVNEPHGELIDRDEVIELFKKYQSELFDYEDILEILQSAKPVVGVK